MRNWSLLVGAIALGATVRPLNANPLMENLRSAYPEVVARWERDCNRGKIDLTYHASQERVFGLCWEPPQEDGSRMGSSLGVLPPHFDPTFSTTCEGRQESLCPDILEVWQTLEPETARVGLQLCASLDGSLVFRRRNDNSIQIRCGYFATRYWDEDGDLEIDGEDPISVAREIGTIQLE